MGAWRWRGRHNSRRPHRPGEDALLTTSRPASIANDGKGNFDDRDDPGRASTKETRFVCFGAGWSTSTTMDTPTVLLTTALSYPEVRPRQPEISGAQPADTFRNRATAHSSSLAREAAPTSMRFMQPWRCFGDFDTRCVTLTSDHECE